MAGAVWEPANGVERGMAAALSGGDSREYARLLGTARLLVPEPPEPGSEREELVAELLPPGASYIVVYTSAEALGYALGTPAGESAALDLAGLRQRWPDPGQLLAVNPGTPIAAFLPPAAIDDLADGTRALAPVAEVQRAAAGQALEQVRALCLRELAGSGPAPAELRDDQPANPLEAALRAAVDGEDIDAYLEALLPAEVVLPVTETVRDPARIYEETFPWRLLGRASGAQVVALFSSPEALAGAGAGDGPRIAVPFLDVLANWPGEQCLLCVNPGTTLELVLPGGTVVDLALAAT